MPNPTDLYPFATADGKAIPLDIIRPSALLRKETAGLITVPAQYKVAIFYSIGGDSTVVGGTAAVPIVNDTILEDVLYIPAGGLVIASLPSSSLYMQPGAGAILVVQFIEKWAGLAVTPQTGRK